MLFECCQYPRKHHGAVYEKYATPKYKQSSTYVEGRMANGLTLSQLYTVPAREEDPSTLLDDDMSLQYHASRNLIPIQG